MRNNETDDEEDEDEEHVVDIEYTELIPWLISHRKIPKTYAKELYKLGQLQAQGVLQLPSTYTKEHSIKFPLTYTRSQQILNTLLSNKTKWHIYDTKNLFGQYHQPVLKTWKNIIDIYEKNYGGKNYSSNNSSSSGDGGGGGYLRLVENVKILRENVEGEGMSLKYKEGKLRQAILEGMKKKIELEKSLENTERKVKERFKEWDIHDNDDEDDEGRLDFKSLVIDSVKRKVKEIVRKFVKIVKEDGVSDVLRYYEDFVGFVEDYKGDCWEGDICQTLKKVRHCDLDSLTRMIMHSYCKDVEDYNGIYIVKSGADNDNINGKGRPSSDECNLGTKGLGGTNNLLIGSGIKKRTAIAHDDLKFSQPAGKKEEQDPLMLVDSEFQSGLINDLFELRAFLVQRATELANPTYSTLSYESVLPKSLSTVTATEINSHLSTINECLNAINGVGARQLLTIWTDDDKGEMLERIVKELEQGVISRERGRGAIIANERKIEEKRTELIQVLGRLEKLKEETRTIKSQVEKTIGETLGGKRAHLLGQLNAFVKS